ncbi:MAG: CvpA family protein [Bryobacteraceae bacterium]|nr:CvpA family protein [Bryobacteraceae bacterium]MDW8376719.1 CvpA family protein [Bryobacterales bacterium]
MNWLDVILGLALGSSVVLGALRGFARTVVGIASTFAAFFLAAWFYGAAGSTFREYVSSKEVANFLGFIAVFLLVILSGAVFGRLLAMAFRWAGVGWLDRTLGACFGLFRGLLISIAIVMIVMAFSLNPPPSSIVQSSLAPYVLDAARLFSKAAPRELTEGFHNSYEKVRQAWREALDSGFEKGRHGKQRNQ